MKRHLRNVHKIEDTIEAYCRNVPVDDNTNEPPKISKNVSHQDNSVSNVNLNVTLPMFGDKENDHYSIEKIGTPAPEKSLEIVRKEVENNVEKNLQPFLQDANSKVLVQNNVKEAKKDVEVPSEQMENVCKICDFSLANSYSLNRHHQKIHQKIPQEKKARCQICLQSLRGRYELKRHLMNVHGLDDLTKDDLESFDAKENVSGRAPNPENTSPGTFEVQQNDQPPIEEGPKVPKLELIPGTKNYNCSECGKSFAKRDYLSRHFSLVHQKIRPHQCNDCEKSYGRPDYLKVHIMSVHQGVRFNCEQCEKTFARKENLGKHVKHIHSIKQEPVEEIAENNQTFNLPNSNAFQPEVSTHHSALEFSHSGTETNQLPKLPDYVTAELIMTDRGLDVFFGGIDIRGFSQEQEYKLKQHVLKEILVRQEKAKKEGLLPPKQIKLGVNDLIGIVRLQ